MSDNQATIAFILVFFLTDTQLTTCRHRDVGQRKDYLHEESMDETKETSPSKENLVEDRPPCSMPNQHRQPIVFEDSDKSLIEPYYVDVLDHDDRITNTQPTGTKPPYARPRLSLPPRERRLEI